MSALKEFAFEQIEREWQPATWALSPAVGRRSDGSCYIRVVNLRPGSPRFGYFRVDADGRVLAAPHGFTKEYKPGRITGLNDAVIEKYKQIWGQKNPERQPHPAADEIARAIGDPGSVVGRKLGPSWGVGNAGYAPEEETVTRWSTRAVLAVLGAGR